MADAQRPLIVKRIKKGGHGHHGGAWKVAYADFVTAMMAFFLLLWLLNAVTDEQLEGISNYFAPISLTSTTSGSGGLLGGETIVSEQVMPDPMSPPSASEELSPPEVDDDDPPPEATKEADLDKLLKQREEKQFGDAKERILQAIEGSPKLKQLAKSILIDNTPEGLRIQIMDQEGLPMFPRGSADMYLHTKRLLELVAGVVLEMPQSVAITGHTDATRYTTDSGYGNWELSADRANAARRQLIHFGIPEQRISYVVGKAATEPLIPEDPEAPANRRLSVVLLSGTGSDEQTAVLDQ